MEYAPALLTYWPSFYTYYGIVVFVGLPSSCTAQIFRGTDFSTSANHYVVKKIFHAALLQIPDIIIKNLKISINKEKINVSD